jgi:hypothetical protein
MLELEAVAERHRSRPVSKGGMSMATARSILVAAAAAAFGLCTSPGLRGESADLVQQQDKQKQIKDETDQVVRRVGTMLRVMDYYQIDKAGQKKLLEEVAGTLSGLSREQMAEVIRRLGAAAVAPDETKSEKEVEAAYTRHREIVLGLKDLLARYDAVRSLDQAADRLDKLALGQLDLHLQTGQTINDFEERHDTGLPPKRSAILTRRLRNLTTVLQRQADDQSDLHRDVSNLLKQAGNLRSKLPAEQQERLQKMEALASERRLSENLTNIGGRLQKVMRSDYRFDKWREANDLQAKVAGDLQQMARVLRLSPEALAALREARDRIDQAIARQENLQEQTKAQKDEQTLAANNLPPNAADTAKSKFVLPGTTPLTPSTPKTLKTEKAAPEKRLQDEKAAQKALDLGKQQARLEHDNKDTRDLLKPHEPKLANQVEKAGEAMKESKTALAKNTPAKALPPQEKAVEQLREIRKELDRQIAAAEKKKTDPLAALKDTADTVDKLLKEQTETRDQTKAAATEKQNLKLPALVGKQQDLAKRTEGLKEKSLPNRPETQPALGKAAKAMAEAAKALEAKKTPDAVPKQDKAIEALQLAQKEIGEKMAELEKRREDISKLEGAAKKLEQLAKQEAKIAEQAKDLLAKPEAGKAKELAKEQAGLTPPTKEVAKQMEKMAPDATQKVAESVKSMEAAKGNLEKNQTASASKQADDAAKKLMEAHEDIAKALGDLKAKDIADQAAMQPNKLDPAAAAQQLAKALEQTQKAAEQSKQADMTRPDPAKAKQKDLAKLQAEVAKDANKIDLPEAGKPAAQAAQALKQGDLSKAVEQQEGALAKLQEAAKKPTVNKPTPPAESKAAQPSVDASARPVAKKGQMKSGEAKAGPPQAGEAKADMENPGQAKIGQAKAGDNPAQSKTNQAQAAVAKPAKPAQAKLSEAKKGGSSKSAQAKAGQAKENQAKADSPKAGQAKAATAKAGPPQAAQAKTGQAKAGEGQAGQPMTGDAKAAQAKAADGEDMAQAQAKAQGSAPMAGEASDASGQPKTPGQLAQAQKGLLDATKAMAKSQESTQAAMAALGQAQAQAPQAVQPLLKDAGQQLAQANQELSQSKPGPANQAQDQAAGKLGEALQTLNKALAAMGQPAVQPGQPSTATASAQPMPPAEGQAQGKDQGKETPGQAQAKAPGQGQPQAKGQGKGDKLAAGKEKNEPLGTGNRTADGKVSSAKSQLSDARGDGSFLHLPPRQREMIRQALSDRLPPEYAPLIQQYFMNLARGRPAAAPNTTPPRKP